MKLAIYPGSFDPPTLGHIDVIERSAKLFDDLIVGVGVNASKQPLLSAEQRVQVIRESCAHLENVRVETFQGMLIDFAKTVGARAIVRGLRATVDFEYEFQMAMVNHRLSENLETLFLMTRWDYSYMSSSIVREVALLGGLRLAGSRTRGAHARKSTGFSVGGGDNLAQRVNPHGNPATSCQNRSVHAPTCVARYLEATLSWIFFACWNS